MIPKNSIVKLYNDDGLYKVIESNGDRLIVSPIEWDYEIIPQETIKESDIEYIMGNDEKRLCRRAYINYHLQSLKSSPPYHNPTYLTDVKYMVRMDERKVYGYELKVY